MAKIDVWQGAVKLQQTDPAELSQAVDASYQNRIPTSEKYDPAYKCLHGFCRQFNVPA